MTPLPGLIGKSIDQIMPEGTFWYPPADSKRVEKDFSDSELEALDAISATPSSSTEPKATKAKPSRLVDIWPEYFDAWAQQLQLPLFWLVPFVFVALQFGCFVRTGDSLFGTLTGGVVESLHLVRTGRSMHWHMFGASTMWALGAVQFLFKPLRRGRWAWVHRILGRAFLALWFFIVGPTSLYLSLFTGTGRLRAQVTMTAFSVVSLDTALFAYYFFWRALLVARRRKNGPASFVLHRKAVTAGIIFTMTILVQRPIQSVIIALRKVLLLGAQFLPATWAGARWIMQNVASTLLDHNVGLSVSTVAISMSLYLFDGPRSWLVRSTLGLNEDETEELFGSREPSKIEVLFWRLRLPCYLLLRAIVTEAWTSDPDSTS